MPFKHPRAEMQARIVDRVERGWSLNRLQREPGFPSIATVERWAAADETWRRRLDEAQRWRRARARPDAWAPTIDWDCAQRLLAEVRAGESLRRLVLRPGFPDWKKLRRWRAERPDFDASLTAASVAARAARAPKWAAFDAAAADRIVLRVAAGERLSEVAGLASRLPCRQIVARWRRENRDFDVALRVAIGVGRKRRGRARRGPGEALTLEVLDAICAGASLADLARRPDMPCSATLNTWLRDDPAFARAVAWASHERELALRDRQVDIARAASAGDLTQAKRAIGAVEARIARMRRRRDREEEAR